MYMYAKIEYVSVRTYRSKNRIRMLRIVEPRLQLPNYQQCGRSRDKHQQQARRKTDMTIWFTNRSLWQLLRVIITDVSMLTTQTAPNHILITHIQTVHI